MDSVDVYKVRTTFRDLKRRGYFAADNSNGEIMITSDAECMASHLRGKRDRINYEGNLHEFHTYLDRYFGRPLVPHDAFLLRRLFKREISELEIGIEKAEAELPKVNCA